MHHLDMQEYGATNVETPLPPQHTHTHTINTPSGCIAKLRVSETINSVKVAGLTLRKSEPLLGTSTLFCLLLLPRAATVAAVKKNKTILTGQINPSQSFTRAVFLSADENNSRSSVSLPAHL